jgi:hypothetical protein
MKTKTKKLVKTKLKNKYIELFNSIDEQVNRVNR